MAGVLKVKKEKVPVVIYTQNHKIEGVIHVFPSARFTDFMRTENVFMPITEVTVYSLPEEKLLFSTGIINLNKSFIAMIYPRKQESCDLPPDEAPSGEEFPGCLPPVDSSGGYESYLEDVIRNPPRPDSPDRPLSREEGTSL